LRTIIELETDANFVTSPNVLRIEELRVKVSGQDVLVFTYEDLTWHMVEHGDHLSMVSENGSPAMLERGYDASSSIQTYAVYWNDLVPQTIGGSSALTNHGGTMQTGAMPWKHTTNPRMVLKLRNTSTARNVIVHIRHHYHQYTAINPVDGRVQSILPF
jgi:hypothetical protein